MLALVIFIGLGLVLPLTWGSIRALRVPERHELVAGALLTIVYALLASTVAALVI
jgi:hypothetical protein